VTAADEIQICFRPFEREARVAWGLQCGPGVVRGGPAGTVAAHRRLLECHAGIFAATMA